MVNVLHLPSRISGFVERVRNTSLWGRTHLPQGSPPPRLARNCATCPAAPSWPCWVSHTTVQAAQAAMPAASGCPVVCYYWTVVEGALGLGADSQATWWPCLRVGTYQCHNQGCPKGGRKKEGQQQRTFTGTSLLHGQDMGKTQNHRNSIEQWRAVGGGWPLAVGTTPYQPKGSRLMLPAYALSLDVEPQSSSRPAHNVNKQRSLSIPSGMVRPMPL